MSARQTGTKPAGKDRSSSTRPDRIQSAERKRRALELRKSGATYQQIAETLGFRAISSAEEAVKRALKDMIREPAESVLNLELARLDHLLMGSYPKAIKGDPVAINSVLRIMAQRARYLGLEVPAQQNPAINLFVFPEWQRIQVIIMDTLAPFPEVRTLLADRLASIADSGASPVPAIEAESDDIIDVD